MKTIVSAFLFLMVSLIVGVLADPSDFQTCYRIDGAVLPNAIRCENSTTGHSACCSAGEVCWSNGVCRGTTQGVKDWLREGCTDHTWSDTACFQVCPWSVGDVAIGVRPCGGIDRSNEYCCDDGSTGVGSFACCSDESNIFAYDNITTLPTILATIPFDDVSTIAVDSTLSSAPTAGTTSDMSTGPLTSESTSKPTSTGSIAIQVTGASTVPTESESSSTNANISTALGAGLGVGLPVAAAIIGGIWLTIWRSKRKDTGGMEQEKEPQYSAPDNLMVPGDNTPKLVSSPSSSRLYGVPSVRGANTHELPSNYYGRELPA